MVTKTQECMNRLKYIPEPTQIDIINITQDVGCSERTGWTALRKLREAAKKASEEITRMQILSSEFLYLQWFMRTCMVLKVEMKALWKKRLIKIADRLDELRVEFRLDEKGVSIVED